jgi:hypothetical protein
LWQEVRPVSGPGVQRLDLADVRTKSGQPLKLEPDRPYNFSVELLVDEKSPAKNPFASCRIERVPAKADLTRALGAAPAQDRAAVFAEAGIWWDLMAELADQIRADPQDAALRQWRADLLRAEEDPRAKPDQQLLRKAADTAS